MAASEVELFNMALSVAGIGRKITSTAERSREVEECSLWYPRARQMVLSGAWWSEALATAPLSLLTERNTNATWVPGNPAPQYLYAYALPENYLHPRYLLQGGRFEIQLRTNNERAIMTNEPNAVLTYTMDQKNPDTWSSMLLLAIANTLAAFVVMGLTGKADRAQNAIQSANSIVAQARATAGNEQNVQYDVLPEWIAVRDYTEPPRRLRYAHPYGEMIFGAMR